MGKNLCLFRIGAPSATRCRSVLMGTMVLAALLGFAGCKKSEPAATEAPAPQPVAATNPTPVATPAAPASADAPAQAPAQANGEPDLKSLNRQYIGYVYRIHHGFKTVEEFAAAMNIKLVPPPPGKIYGFDSKGYIALLNQ